MIMLCIECCHRKTIQPFRSAIEKKWTCWKCYGVPYISPAPKPFKVEIIKSRRKKK